MTAQKKSSGENPADLYNKHPISIFRNKNKINNNMADCLRLNIWIFIGIIVVHMVLSSSIVKRDTVEIEQQQIDPVLQVR